MASRDLAALFRGFSKLEGRGYSSLYERLSLTIADDPKLLALLDTAPVHQRQPTLLYAALHDLVLAHPQADLARWYPTVTGGPVPDDDVAPALRAFCVAYEPEIRHLVSTRSTQTNEVRRCAALVLAFDRIATEVQRPLGLIELGASGGLNLLFDRFSYDYGELGTVGERGSPVHISTTLRGPRRPRLPAAAARAGRRIGIDLEPVDVRDPEATRWLEACLFADQLDRRDRLRAALTLARADPPEMRQGDMLGLLPAAATDIPHNEHLCLVSTWAVHYLAQERRRALDDLVREIGRRRDLSWVAAEPSGVLSGVSEPPVDPETPHPTILSLTTIRTGTWRRRLLARTHSHAAWIEWLDRDL